VNTTSEERRDKILGGKVPLREVSIAEFLELNIMSMVSGDQTDLDVSIQHGGSFYEVTTSVKRIIPPERLKNIMRKQ
jgi:hypothetical protein